jgi:hypothetical protein
MIPRYTVSMRLALLAVLAGGATAAAAAPIHLAPALSGNYQTGGGADATFVHIDDEWRGSTVLWNEATRSFGSGDAISSFSRGTGLWGMSDWHTVMGMAAGPLLSSWTGTASSINFGNQLYNDAYASIWGQAQSLPGTATETNWAASFSGYIRIAESGLYNFSVLFDDGFNFVLSGAGGDSVSIGADYIKPRDRIGFADNLALDPGLYPFTLASYNRAEAGVVDLRWQRVGSGAGWTLVPTENLVGAAAVAAIPEPSSLLLLGGGLAALCARRRHAAAQPLAASARVRRPA